MMCIGLKKKLLNWYICLIQKQHTNKEPEMNTRKLTYTGKSVYIGIDVHKKSYTFSAYCDGIICKTATVPANPGEFCTESQEVVPRWETVQCV